MTQRLHLPPLALYVHIPWCVRKCPYCDFNSHQAGQTLPEAEYRAALRADLESDRILAQGRPLTSIFFGGGTPSLFSAATIAGILEDAEELIGFTPDIEITLEANPGTFEQERFRAYRAAGVNRLSIGIQSFDPQKLARLGRIHGGEEALSAVGVARRAGFDNLNLDLMHGLPDQDTRGARADLQQALDLGPEHVSWYQLTIEPNTAFYNAPPVLPEENSLADIQASGESLLAEAGYAQYEVSAYARPGRQARHNLNYWRYGDYLGVGAGAHGKITLPEQAQILRLWKTRLPKHYLEKGKPSAGVTEHSNPFMAGQEFMEPQARPLDFLLNALRLNEGVTAEIFRERTGLGMDALEPQWSELRTLGLVGSDNSRLTTTALGRRFLNDVLGRYS
ncbi:radical SAM family heme chaperone HemW [Marinimicrobium sp. ABcell2]|uniref:radical SAM family heme chaperone HemW n=1 Tax=Marinimicrobium sp. ABcell2 TaxID=3069751 RepID=UPI0027B4CE90|nr:radical SAM family heme chaperone HemW [Marinimicrobium sp. ABcell2]MDQ2076598.1 radical SAM family heme chaperone HemW [Marinimicrobium sp. ABcell2]